MNDIILNIKNLSKEYKGFFAVKDINLNVNKGEIIGIIGPNGAGKTTTIKLIAKLLKPTYGNIFIKNNRNILQDINNNSKNLISMGFLIDIPKFYNSTPYILLKHYAKLQCYPKEKINQRIDELLTCFNLDGWKFKKIKTFSKGMKQKLGFIQAIIHDPELIVLDEPQTGLDPNARIEIRKYLKKLKVKEKTVIITSHILHEISEICDKVALINNGSIIVFDFIENLEKLLKKNEIICNLLNPIPLERIEQIKMKLSEKLAPFLDKKLDLSIYNSPIQYQNSSKDLIIYYDGKIESKSEIFKILGKDFESDLKIISFTQSKVSLLERIYSEMIKEKKLG